MDSNIATQKMQKTADTPSGVDPARILPESILIQILSLLPTEDAVASSKLSHDWKDKWRFISSLHLDDTRFYFREGRTSMDSFVKFVYYVLRNLSSLSIRSFKLSLSNMYDPQHVHSWVSSLLRRGVEGVYVEGMIPRLPQNLFKCNSLVELELNSSSSITVGPLVYLENLKVLKLCTVNFVVDCLPNSEELVFSFPTLKVFRVDLCVWSDVKDIVVEAPELERFQMVYPSLKSNNDRSSSSIVRVFASKLRKFSFKFSGREDIFLSDSSTISVASIDIFSPYHMKDDDTFQIGAKVDKLVKQFHRLEYLKLGSNLVQVLSDIRYYTMILPVLENLVNLELSFCYISSQSMLLKLLHRAPIIQKLVLVFVAMKFNIDILNREEVPHCVVSNLKCVELRVYTWDENILCLAKYMLEHCQVLELMVVSIREMTAKVDATKKVEDVLLKAPRASGSASIQIVT